MMTTDDEKQLDQAFAEMRAHAVVPSEGLLDRIMMDADQVLSDITSLPNVDRPTATETPQGFGRALLEAIGGWMPIGGLTAAAMAGLWVGVYPPDVLYDSSAEVWGDTIEVPVLESDVFAGLEG